MKKVICFFVCVLICIGFSVKAQVTTSVLSGKIIDDQNEYVIGATVGGTRTIRNHVWCGNECGWPLHDPGNAYRRTL